MAQSNFDSCTEICAANIAILYLLHQVPRSPFKNSVEGNFVCRHDYVLPFEMERRLANTLAFLSSIEHDPQRVPAVAIVEGPRRLPLNMLVAVNKAAHSDGAHNLQRIKAGFEGVFTALSKSPPTSNHEDRVLEAIIEMCSQRILCRLRLEENSRKQKQPIIGVMNEAIPPLQRLRSAKLQHVQTLVDLTLKRMKIVIKLVETWKKHQRAGSLKNVVVGMNDLWHVGELPTILEAIPNRDMSPSSRKNLLNTIQKVARYHDSAKILCRIAKKYPLVHDMTVISVELPPEAFDRPAPTQDIPTLEHALHGFDIARKQANINNVYGLLKVHKDHANNLFTEQVSRTLSEAKIHAEIQIIFYCELNRISKPPRIVCSSKDACFLCNTFISMYKKTYTPRCHGRLYPGWRLPHLQAFVGMKEAFNEVLGQLINDSLRALLLTGKKTMYPDPNESTLFTLPISASTLFTAKSASSEQIESPKITPSEPLLTECCGSKTSPAISDQKSETIGDMTEQISELPKPTSVPPNMNESRISSLVENGDIDLVQGLEVLGSINRHRLSQLCRAGPLEVQLEYSSDSSHSVRNTTDLSGIPVKIKWLSQEELDAYRKVDGFPVIDAYLLCCETDFTVKGQEVIHIAAGESVLRIEFCPRT